MGNAETEVISMTKAVKLTLSKDPSFKDDEHANGYANGHANGHTNGRVPSYANGHTPTTEEVVKASEKQDLTAGALYRLMLDAKPPAGGWFSVADTATRLGLALGAFYWFLLTQPLSLLRFAFGWNSLWYGKALGALLTLWLPVLPFALCGMEVAKRINESMPWAETDWKMQGPGRVFFTRPSSFVASVLWDFTLALTVFCGTFLQFGTDADGLMHTWYDSICVKEFWNKLLDAGGARRPLQLGRWDGGECHDVGPGVSFGRANLVCKISDSYLGIGDRVLTRNKARGGDFDTLADVNALLSADAEYAGKTAVLSELILPDPDLPVSTEGFGNVHSLDIVTIRTRAGVRVLTALLWTDCEGWSSHSCTAGYLLDIEKETVASATAWYSPHFAACDSPLVGTHLPGIREACAKAIAAHEACDLPWLTTVGWDAMITPDGVVFFEGNVAAYRTPRRMFLSPALTLEFFKECRGAGSPVPQPSPF